MAFAILLAVVGFVAGGIASVAGFGIGSLLTPLLALQTGTKLAVAAISIPHAAATAVRLWLLRRSIDRRVLWNFGVTSAAGGLPSCCSWEFSCLRALEPRVPFPLSWRPARD
jgi:uncharacterized membrane protein YfcA